MNINTRGVRATSRARQWRVWRQARASSREWNIGQMSTLGAMSDEGDVTRSRSALDVER